MPTIAIGSLPASSPSQARACWAMTASLTAERRQRLGFPVARSLIGLPAAGELVVVGQLLDLVQKSMQVDVSSGTTGSPARPTAARRLDRRPARRRARRGGRSARRRWVVPGGWPTAGAGGSSSRLRQARGPHQGVEAEGSKGSAGGSRAGPQEAEPLVTSPARSAGPPLAAPPALAPRQALEQTVRRACDALPSGRSAEERHATADAADSPLAQSIGTTATTGTGALTRAAKRGLPLSAEKC